MAALLGLFGLAATNQGGQHGVLQLLLAGLSLGAAVYLRQGTPEARMFGLGVAVLTVAVGAWLIVAQSVYLPGTIVAVFALIRLGTTPAVSPTSPAGAMPASTMPPGAMPPGTTPFGSTPFGTTPFGTTPPQWAAPAAEGRPSEADGDVNPWRAPDQ